MSIYSSSVRSRDGLTADLFRLLGDADNACLATAVDDGGLFCPTVLARAHITASESSFSFVIDEQMYNRTVNGLSLCILALDLLFPQWNKDTNNAQRRLHRHLDAIEALKLSGTEISEAAASILSSSIGIGAQLRPIVDPDLYSGYPQDGGAGSHLATTSAQPAFGMYIAAPLNVMPFMFLDPSRC